MLISRATGLGLPLAVALGLAGYVLWNLGGRATADMDVWHELALIREVLQTGELPRSDVFAYTPTVSPSVHHEWGTGAVFYFTAHAFGGNGLVWLRYLLLAVTLIAATVCARRRGGEGLEITASAVMALVLMMSWLAPVLRAQAFTLALLAALLLLLEEDRRGRRWWIALWLALFVAWLNLHGGFLVGAGVFGLHAAEQFARVWADQRSVRRALGATTHLAATGGAMVALTWANPYGADYLPYLWHAVRMDRDFILEWQALWELDMPSLVGVYAASLLGVAYAAYSRGWRALPGLPVVLVSAWLGARHARHVSLYAVVWLCYFPAYLDGTPLGRQFREIWRTRRLVIGGVAIVGGIAGIVHAWQARFWELRVPNALDARRAAAGDTMVYPVGAVEYLEQQGFHGNVMTHHNWGAYVSWKLHPGVRVSMDSRFEAAYEAGLAREVLEFYRGAPSWRKTLGRFGTDAVIVPRDGPLAALLAQYEADRWRAVYRDDGFVLYARADLSAPLPAVDRTGEAIEGELP